eukprot:scaffold884_cov398-Prasinococcus_capsulatus_cf.AAC.21
MDQEVCSIQEEVMLDGPEPGHEVLPPHEQGQQLLARKAIGGVDSLQVRTIRRVVLDGAVLGRWIDDVLAALPDCVEVLAAVKDLGCHILQEHRHAGSADAISGLPVVGVEVIHQRFLAQAGLLLHHELVVRIVDLASIDPSIQALEVWHRGRLQQCQQDGPGLGLARCQHEAVVDEIQHGRPFHTLLLGHIDQLGEQRHHVECRLRVEPQGLHAETTQAVLVLQLRD